LPRYIAIVWTGRDLPFYIGGWPGYFVVVGGQVATCPYRG